MNPVSRWRAGARGTGAGCVWPIRARCRRTCPTLEAHSIDAEFVGGAFSPALLDGGIELVADEPGSCRRSPPILLPLIAGARERGIPVWGELEFFAQALRTLGESGYAPKVIAITGTNGKTTTTSLTGLLCERAGKKVAVAGNISPTMLDKLSRSDRQHRVARCLGAGAVELPAGDRADV